MRQQILKVHPDDNLIVALEQLEPGMHVQMNGKTIEIKDSIKPKHKFAEHDLLVGDSVYMYGVLVGKAQLSIPAGGLIQTFNVKHAAAAYSLGDRKLDWNKPDVSKYETKHFMGFHRADGGVGTANYWIVLPMVFCENRNMDIMKAALVEDLGYSPSSKYKNLSKELINLYKAGTTAEEILNTPIITDLSANQAGKLFENVDGVKFLNHDMGCGGTRSDAQALCALLAGYIAHPNVAGATVLSLGCQNAQYSMLQEELAKRNCKEKPIFFLEQQQIGTEEEMIQQAITKTFAGLIEANKCERAPAPLSKLILGQECGGSDGFSGISANPAMGHAADLLVALGGSVILSEFPELCGVEQELSDRCVEVPKAERFIHLMRTYAEKAVQAGSGFDMNPSPGNIKDGLITDAIKSAGAAKKGGTSPVTDVLDYTEPVVSAGLNLLCTPGNDVESTTAMAGSGANVMLFSTGLGTPTGNPIAPVIKVASNTVLAEKMHDIIDIDTGAVIRGELSIEQMGEQILDFVIDVASGSKKPKAVLNNQDDFIPWKRGVSL